MSRSDLEFPAFAADLFRCDPVRIDRNEGGDPMKIFCYGTLTVGTTMPMGLRVSTGVSAVRTVPSGPYPTIQSAVEEP